MLDETCFLRPFGSIPFHTNHPTKQLLNVTLRKEDIKIQQINKYIQKCNILGVNIAVTSLDKTVPFIINNLHVLSGQYICVSNVHTTIMGFDNKEYRDIQNRSVLSLPDGGPLSVLERKMGYMEAERVTGPDLMGKLFELSGEPKRAVYAQRPPGGHELWDGRLGESNNNKQQLRHFFYGSTEETLRKLKCNLQQQYPHLVIAGMYAPPFRELNEAENKKIVEMIHKAQADIIWVGLGAPKQEIWMSRHEGVFDGLMIGVGAGFDYYAGNLRRAPLWMQKHSLEWLYRLLQNPKRLLKRYLYTNIKFIWLVKKTFFTKVAKNKFNVLAIRKKAGPLDHYKRFVSGVNHGKNRRN